MSKLKSFQAQIQETITKGINAVEEQHKTLAEKAFGYVEKLETEAKEYSVVKLHEAHDSAVEKGYSFVRDLNEKLANAADQLVDKVEGQAEEVAEKVEEVAEEVAEKAAEVKATAKKTTRKAAVKKEEATA